MGQGVVWDRRSAAAAGIGPRRLAGSGFQRVTRDAYVDTEHADDLALRCAAVLSRVPSAVVSHWTAAEVLQLPGPARARTGIHVTVGPEVRAPRRRSVVAHSAEGPVEAWTVRGVPVTAPWRTWCDCAAGGAELADLVALGDAVLHRWPKHDERLRREVLSRVRRRGVRTARSALQLLDGRAESAMESRVRVLLAMGGVPAPVLQLVVRTADDAFVARVDLGWPSRRLALEYDSRHHLERSQWLRDLRRREQLEALGWRVLVLTADDVLGDPAGVVRRVQAALDS